MNEQIRAEFEQAFRKSRRDMMSDALEDMLLQDASGHYFSAEADLAFHYWKASHNHYKVSASANYWKAEHLAGNEKIEQLERQVKDLQAAHARYAGSGAEAVNWSNFPSYLIDNHEGDVITEEGLQSALAGMLNDPKYTHPPAQPKVPAKKRPCQIETDEEIPSHLLAALREAFSHYGLEIKEFDCVEDDDVCCGNYQSCTGAKFILSAQENASPAPAVPEGFKIDRGSVAYKEIIVTAPDGGQQIFWPDDAAYGVVAAMLTQATKESDK